MEDLKDEIKKRQKDGWIEAWLAIEALGIGGDVVKDALEKHVGHMSKSKDVFVYEKKFSEARKIDNLSEKVKEAYSQIVETKVLFKDLYSLINVVLLYGPSSVEIIGPNSKEVRIDEMQSVCNTLASLVHQFAAAGIGGMLVTPK